MKSLRVKFVRQIALVFLAICVSLFLVFAGLMTVFFFKTVETLDGMENKLAGEDMNMRLSEYQVATESLAKNANLVDMLVNCTTAEAFNADHNYNLIAESMSRTQTEEQKEISSLWIYSLEHEYGMRNGEDGAKPLHLSDMDRTGFVVLEKKLETTIFIGYTSENEDTLFNVITPIRREGRLCGLIGTSMDLKALLNGSMQKTGINNMVTEYSLVIPSLDEEMGVASYAEYYLEQEEVKKNELSLDFLSEYENNVVEDYSRTGGEKGKKYVSPAGASGWYLISFVSNKTVQDAFIKNYAPLGAGIYILTLIGMMLVVVWLSHRMTKPIQELDSLVDNIRNHRSYERLKGNNEVTRAADSLIELVNDNVSLLDEIGELAQQIERGELFTRFRIESDGTTQHEIKESLNHMLNSISYILDNLSVGIAIIDENYGIIYINANVRKLTGIDVLQKGALIEDFTQINEKARKVIIKGIDSCKNGVADQGGRISVGGKHLVVSTTRLQYTGQDGRKAVFLQLYLNQTEVIEKIREQEQIFAYFNHLSLVKKEALDRLAKGDFKHAQMEVGACPSAPYLKEIYDTQVEMKQAFAETVNHVESIITELEKATKAFSDGELHMTVDVSNAKGQYEALVKTANNAFHVILNYFQYLPIPIRIIDQNFRIRFYNEASYQSGFRPGREVKCYHWYNQTKPCDRCPFIGGGREISVMEYTCEKEGRRRHWRRYRNPMLDEMGNITSILEILIDETRIVELKKEADSANRAKSMFIANMSHEIRTPMNAILGYSQLMEMSTALSEPDRRYVETIKRSGSHLLSLINDILELSKIEAGKITLSEECFNLDSLLEDVRAVFTPQIDAKGLQLEIRTKEGLYKELMGDIGKIRQILFNVVSNAIKFTPDGKITLEVETEQSGVDIVRVIADVTDTGCGIAEEERDKVFTAFEQAEAGVKSGMGTGLGMAISRNFAKMMHGDLEIMSSEPGKGTTFRIMLELPAGHSSQNKQGIQKSYSNINGMYTEKSALIIDTVSDNRELLQKILQRLGFYVIPAESNEHAMKLWRELAPDLLTTDLSDGGMSGIELVKTIRKAEKNMYTPIIVITADVLETNKEEALQAGVDVFMTKPLVIEKLAKEIERLTGAQYIFGEAKADIVTETDTGREHINAEMKIQIYEAVMRGDFDRVTVLAGHIAQECPSLSIKLAEYAEDFDKDAICSLLNMEEAN